jgi:antibiotic biosynthesis monooxygenase (ABM) superfamily enzyme
MYGTVARFRVKPGMEKEIEAIVRDFERTPPPGYIGEYIYRMDSDPQTYIMAVMFKSKEAYFANADSPQQDAEYRKFRELLESDPEWMDGEIVAFPGMS